MKFLTENIAWIGLALGSGVMLLWPMLRGAVSGAADLSATEAVLLINRENALVLDVRNEDEFVAGHIANARNIPLIQLPDRMNELRKYQQKPIIVSCQTSTRSGGACAQLRKAGYTRIYNLRGGLNDWKAASLPLVL